MMMLYLALFFVAAEAAPFRTLLDDTDQSICQVNFFFFVCFMTCNIIHI